MKLDKRLVDDVIRLTKKHYERGDKDYLLPLIEAKEVLEKGALWQVVDLVSNLAKYTRLSRTGTYDDIYKALAVFGIIVEDKEKKNE